MTKTNAIVNGTFDRGNAGWTGSDMETNHAEGAYLGNRSGNRVAEADGNRGQTTVMQQNITVNWGQTTSLNFRTALRTASSGNAGRDGFRVDVADASGTIIATQTFLPRSANWSAQSMAVTFPTGGTYTVRFTEVGPDDSLGAIFDDVSMLVCFVAGTLIETATGPRAVETLVPGDPVWTLDKGYLPLRWIGRRDLTQADLMADVRLRPVQFAPGSLGGGQPLRQMMLSPQHRVCRGGWKSELHFGQPEVLVPAKALINGDSIRVADVAQGVSYVHFLLDGHQIVRSDGVLTESFFPTRLSLSGVDHAARAELLRLFPDICDAAQAFAQTARPVLHRAEAALIR